MFYNVYDVIHYVKQFLRRSVSNSSVSIYKGVAKRQRSRPSDLLISPHRTLSAMQKTAQDCKACDLWKRGTQTIFGEGGPDAKVIFVGEQLGDRDDLEGRPFVGPAGELLDKALVEACPSVTWLTGIAEAVLRSSQKLEEAAVAVGPRPNHDVGAAPVRQGCIVIGA